jgi:hypothetical protein
MKVVAAMMMLTVAALPPNSTLWTAAAPPLRYRGEVEVVVRFVRDPAAACRAAGMNAPPPGMEIIACRVGGSIIMPLPEETDPYGQIMQHELGHALGWPATHGD